MGTKTDEEYAEGFRVEIEQLLDRRALMPRAIFEEATAKRSRTYGEYRGPAYLFRWTIERKTGSPTRFQLALLRPNGQTVAKMWKTQNMGSSWIAQFGTDKAPDTCHFRGTCVEGLIQGIPAKRLVSRIIEASKSARILS